MDISVETMDKENGEIIGYIEDLTKNAYGKNVCLEEYIKVLKNETIYINNNDGINSIKAESLKDELNKKTLEQDIKFLDLFSKVKSYYKVDYIFEIETKKEEELKKIKVLQDVIENTIQYREIIDSLETENDILKANNEKLQNSLKSIKLGYRIKNSYKK